MKIGLIVIILFSTTSYGQFRKLDTLPPRPGGYPKSVLKIEKENHKCMDTDAWYPLVPIYGNPPFRSW